MNLILIISDTLRRDHLGCYGNDWISTSNIDRFAARSLVFDRAYSGSFPTVPNRRDVLTGRYTATYTDWAPLSNEEVVLPAVLGSNGYTSMMVCDSSTMCVSLLYDTPNKATSEPGGIFCWIWANTRDGTALLTATTWGASRGS